MKVVQPFCVLRKVCEPSQLRAVLAKMAVVLALSFTIAFSTGAMMSTPPDPPAEPANLQELECAVHKFAFSFGVQRLPLADRALADALNLADCAGTTTTLDDTHMPTSNETARQISRIYQHARTVGRRSNNHVPWRRQLAVSTQRRAATEFFVATTGNDKSAGTRASPFATFERAAAAARAAAAKPVVVTVAAGKYHFTSTLRLGPADSDVTWQAAAGAKVTLSGGVRLEPEWRQSDLGRGILVADVNRSLGVMSHDEQLYWQKKSSSSSSSSTLSRPWPSVPQSSTSVPPTLGVRQEAPPAHKWGAPPARWNTLHVDEVRQVRARAPNGNPQDNTGKCFSKVQHEGEGCDGWFSAVGQVGSLPPSTKVADIASGTDRNRAPDSPTDGGGSCGTFQCSIYDPPKGHPVYNKPMPDWTWTNNSLFAFWSDPMSRPGGVVYGDAINKTYANAATAVVHMFHGMLWGGWQFQVVDQDHENRSLMFSHGGYQESRGGSISNNHFYVENVLEELDTPGEWYYDPIDSRLYFYPNTTNNKPGREVVAPLLSAIVRVEGASRVVFRGFTFTETRATFLEQYEVPSGGDWSVHRGATLEIVDSTNITVADCTFDQVGGNGVLLSNAARGCLVAQNEFVQTGDSAIVSVGTAVGIDGTAQTYPRWNIIAGNHMHEIGVYGKQTSCYFQALGQENRVEDNLCYNGPRAGINWNDGFAGGSSVRGNLVFNQVRETGDHGPYNSWDRHPYLTHSGVPDGFPPSMKHGTTNASILKAYDEIVSNFFINGYNGVWTIDHDDGSQRFNDTSNFMVFGGCKNFLGNHKSCDHNVIVHPGIASRAAGGRRCQTDDNSVFQNQYHMDNHCVTQDGTFYSMGGFDTCTRVNVTPHVFQTFNNTLYSETSNFSNGPCASFAAWQAAGQDRESRVLPMPTIVDVVAMGRAVLGVEV